MSISIKRFSVTALGIYALVSLLHAWQLPFSADEAHYALYASYLDWSYFDHPPMVGWLQSIALAVSSDEFTLRIIPILMTAASLLLLFNLTKQEFGDKQAWVALLLFMSAPILNIIPFGMIPETPLVLAGFICVWAVLNIVKSDGLILKHWLVLGFALGASGLSKYTGVTLAFSTALVLFAHFKLSTFKFFGLYLAGLIAAACISPVLIWNMQNEWISFNYQLNHGAGKSTFELSKIAQMQGAQIASYGFLIYVAGLIAVFKFIKSSQHRVWLIFALPILLLFSFMAAKGRSLPHWTELGVLFLLPIIADWMVKSWSTKWVKVLSVSLASLSFLLVIVTQVLMFYPNFKFPDFKHPAADLIGWKEAGKLVSDNAEADEQLFIQNWSYASRAAWYSRYRPVKVLDTRFDQFDMWHGQAELGDSGLLLMVATKKGFKEHLLNRFETCTQLDQLEIKIKGNYVNHFKLYRCQNYSYEQETK